MMVKGMLPVEPGGFSLKKKKSPEQYRSQLNNNTTTTIMMISTTLLILGLLVASAPGFSFIPINVTCCPDVPLVGPSYEITELDGETLETCWFDNFVRFHSDGKVYGYFGCDFVIPGQYELNFDQLYISNIQNTGHCHCTGFEQPTQSVDDMKVQQTQVIDALLNRVSTRVRIGTDIFELRDSDNTTVARLEALTYMYTCDSSACPVDDEPEPGSTDAPQVTTTTEVISTTPPSPTSLPLTESTVAKTTFLVSDASTIMTHVATSWTACGATMLFALVGML